MRRDTTSESLDIHDMNELYQPGQRSIVRRDVPTKRELRQTCLERDKRKPVEIYPEREPEVSFRNILF